MKKLLTILLSIFFLFACENKNSSKLIVGASPLPHAQILEQVKEDLKKEGIDLEIVVFNDYIQPNISLKDKSIDANFFQHIPYMKSFAKEYNIDMISAGAIHLEPIKIYSEKIKNINDVPENAKVLIPNDPTNRGRSLILLEDAGLIKLKDKTKLDSDINDIKENPKNINITTLNSEQIGPRLKEIDIAIINTNNALASNISKEKAIYTEGKDSPYSNVITILKEIENDDKIKKLVKALQSEKIKQFIEKTYNGEIAPAF